MNQPDSANVQNSVEAINSAETAADVYEATTPGPREWLPEDEDEWYEPDYCKSDRRPS